MIDLTIALIILIIGFMVFLIIGIAAESGSLIMIGGIFIIILGFVLLGHDLTDFDWLSITAIFGLGVICMGIGCVACYENGI